MFETLASEQSRASLHDSSESDTSDLNMLYGTSSPTHKQTGLSAKLGSRSEEWSATRSQPAEQQGGVHGFADALAVYASSSPTSSPPAPTSTGNLSDRPDGLPAIAELSDEVSAASVPSRLLPTDAGATHRSAPRSTQAASAGPQNLLQARPLTDRSTSDNSSALRSSPCGSDSDGAETEWSQAGASAPRVPPLDMLFYAADRERARATDVARRRDVLDAARRMATASSALNTARGGTTARSLEVRQLVLANVAAAAKLAQELETLDDSSLPSAPPRRARTASAVSRNARRQPSRAAQRSHKPREQQPAMPPAATASPSVPAAPTVFVADKVVVVPAPLRPASAPMLQEPIDMDFLRFRHQRLVLPDLGIGPSPRNTTLPVLQAAPPSRRSTGALAPEKMASVCLQTDRNVLRTPSPTVEWPRPGLYWIWMLCTGA
jgi:hypothetical protein